MAPVSIQGAELVNSAQDKTCREAWPFWSYMFGCNGLRSVLEQLHAVNVHGEPRLHNYSSVGIAVCLTLSD